VHFDGADVGALRGSALRAMRRRMQVVLQDPDGTLDPRQKVGSAIREVLRAHQVVIRADENDTIARLLSEVDLAAEIADRLPHQLSGGQRQRVSLARALALEPTVLILDEPTSALDVSVQAQVLELLDEIQSRLGIALLFITHDLRVAAQICDDVAVMQHGRVVEHGPAAQVLADPKVAYTRALLDAAPGRGWDFANFRPVPSGAVAN
jgi:peptide/nickel transport system ATP-binding protein